MQYVKEKMETLEDMPGDENCIETPLSQLVQWSCLLVLRNPCIGCLTLLFFCFVFVFFSLTIRIIYYSLTNY